MSKKKILTYIGSPLLSLVLLTATAFAINSIAEGYRVTAGATKVKVTSNSDCQTVSNAGSSDIFIPTNTANEWNLFQQNKPSFVTLGACTTPAMAPQNLTATAVDQQITLNWSAPTDNGGSAVTGYKIYRGTSSGGETFVDQVGNVLTYTNPGLTAGTIYYYKISAITNTEGVQSSEVNAKISQYTAVTINCMTGATTGYPGPYATKDLAVNATLASLQTCLTNNSFITPVTISYSSYSTLSGGHSIRHVYQSGSFGLSNPNCTYSSNGIPQTVGYPYKTWAYKDLNQIVQGYKSDGVTPTYTGTTRELYYGDRSYVQGYSTVVSCPPVYPEQVTYHTTVCNGQSDVSACSNSDIPITTYRVQ